MKGQRYQIIVTANATFEYGTDFWMRAQDCSVPAGIPPSTVGIIRYNASSIAVPYTFNDTSKDTFGCDDPPAASIVPVVRRTVGSPINDFSPASYLNGGTQGYPNTSDLASPLFKWLLTDESLIVNWTDPVLKVLYDNNDTTGETLPADASPVFLNYTEGDWVYFVIQTNFTVTDRVAQSIRHPIHLHGHDFVILAQGSGAFDASTTTFNLDNPPRRDTAMVDLNGHLVIAFQVNNPGTWLIHCHIPWHSSSGMALQFVELSDQIIPGLISNDVMPEMDDTCDAWATQYNTINIPAGAVHDLAESGV